MQINITYDASVTGAPTGFKAAVQAAVTYLESVITTPITLNIAFGFGEIAGQALDANALGESQPTMSHYSYGQIASGLKAAATSADDLAADAALSALDPTNGGAFSMASAEAKALGLYSGAANAIDGYIGLSSTAPFTYDPQNRAVSNEYDAIGVLVHEITEVMGRVAGAGEVASSGGPPQYAPLDLFRYVQPGQLALTGVPAYFSINGQALLTGFDSGSSGGDSGDWASSSGGQPIALTKDAFNSFSLPGFAYELTAVDLREMDVLGFAIRQAAPTDFSAIVALDGVTATVFDSVTGRFYIGTSAGVLDAYDPGKGTLTKLAALSQSIQGIAVSPDGQSLYVGQTVVTNSPANASVTQASIDRIELGSGAVQSLTFTVAPGDGEVGTFSVVLAANGQAFFSTNVNGSGFVPIREFDTGSSSFDPVWTSLRGVGSDLVAGPQLTLSEHGKYLLVAIDSDTGGSLYLVDPATGALLASTDSFKLGDGGSPTSEKDDINDTIGLVADLSDMHLMILDTSLGLVKDLSSLQQNADAIIGVRFNQDGSELYLWSEPQNAILVYSTATWTQVGAIPLGVGVADLVFGASRTGQMTLADNGRLLLLSTGSGFEIVDLRPGEHRYDFAGDGLGHVLMQNAAGVVAVGAVSEGAASFAPVGGLGPEWKFEGVGDLLGDGRNDFLIKNDAGAVLAGEVVAGQAAYTLLTGLGPEWSFRGVGDFLGEGHDQFLIENGAGAIVVGDHANGQTAFTLVSALGPEWSFRGAGDFLGDGKSDFLVENSAGALVVGEAANGAAQLSLVGALGQEWRFVGSGDFLGDGKDDFLIENSAGAIVAGEVVAGQMSLTLLTALGPEWSFRGAGDYLGEGHDQFLIENSGGVLAIGDFSGGAMHLTAVSSLGPEWIFH